MSSGERVQVAVVGAGIAGLSLAYRLMQRGVEVRVLEGASRAGGNIQSELHQGYRCEWGPNGFLDNEPATLRLVDDLGLREQLAPASPLANTRWIVRGGKLRALPTKPQAFLTSDVLSVAGRARVLLEWAQPAMKTGDDESVWDFAHRRIGREAADVLVDAMVTGVYAGDPRRLSLEAAFPRMRAMERDYGSLLGAMRAMKRAGKAGGGPMGPGGTLTSFRDGMETMVLALVQALGTRVALGHRLVSLRQQSGGWHLEFERGASLECDRVVLASPAWHASGLVQPLDADLSRELDAIPSAPVVVVCVGWKAADVAGVTPGFGFLLPSRERFGILGTLFDSCVFPARAPQGQALWRTLLGGARDRGAIDLDDGTILDRVLRAYQKLLGLRATPDMIYIVRHARGIPQYPVGHVQRVHRIEEHTARLPGLTLSGNSYHGIAMNACIKESEALAAGWDAARNVPAR